MEGVDILLLRFPSALYLDGCNFSTAARVGTMFGGRIRKGKRGRAVSAGSVRASIMRVNTTITLDMGRQPLHQLDGVHYIKTSLDVTTTRQYIILIVFGNNHV